jgi:hypothetical protein
MIKKPILVLLCFLFVGCGELFKFGTRCEFEISNESDYNVEISFFLKSNLEKVIKIKKGKVYSQNFKDCTRIENPININPDSVIIQFDDRRFIKQYCNGKTFFGNFSDCRFEKNFIDGAAYLGVHRSITSLKRITLENSDYEKALPL